MSTIDRITPVLARIVVAVAIITLIGSVTAAYLFSEPRLVSFAGFAFISAAYARKVARGTDSVTAPAAIEASKVHPLAA